MIIPSTLFFFASSINPGGSLPGKGKRSQFLAEYNYPLQAVATNPLNYNKLTKIILINLNYADTIVNCKTM